MFLNAILFSMLLLYPLNLITLKISFITRYKMLGPIHVVVLDKYMNLQRYKLQIKVYISNVVVLERNLKFTTAMLASLNY